MRAAMLAALAAVAAALIVPAASAAGSGEIVFVSLRSGTQELYIVNRDGSGLRRLTYNNLAERQPVWSPDRTRIAFAGRDAGGNYDIYTVDASGGDLRRLTTDPGRDDAPQWTADGRILYQHGPLAGSDTTAWIVAADGTGARQLPTGDGDAIEPSASPRGDKVAFASDRGHPGVWAIYTMQLSGHALRQVTSPTAGMDLQPRWSPNGNDLVFVRDNGTNDNDLYREHDNGTQLVRLTDTPGSSEFWPSWSADGGELVYSAFDDSTGFGSLHVMPAAGGDSSPLSTDPRAPLTETFDSGVLDSSLWHVISDPGGTIGESGGRLVASISGSAVPGGPYNQVDEHIGSQCSLNGDFDLQVHYSLLTWPEYGGVYAALQAFFGNAGISRTSGPWTPPYNQQYVAYSDTGFASLNTLDTSGSLRLVRTAGVVTAYERSDGSDWTTLFTGGAPNPVVYGFGLWAQGDQFAHQDAAVAFDDFRLDSGELTCPSWWESWGADAA